MKITLIALFCLFVSRLYGQGAVDSSMEQFSVLNESMYPDVVGKMLPRFSARDTSGNIYDHAIFQKRKVTFINLWFSACPPCISEIPNLNALFQSMKDSVDFQFLSLTWEQETRAKKSIRQYDITYPVLFVTPAESRELTFGRGYPTSILVDQTGKILFILSGGSTDHMQGIENWWKKKIENYLRKEQL